MNVYPFIEAEKRTGTGTARGGNVARACELLKVSRSAYYAHAARRAAGPSPRERADAQLREVIVKIHTGSAGTYGSPRVHAELTDTGYHHGRKRVARLMREVGIAGVRPRQWRKTTIADPAAPVRADLIGRDFAAGGATDLVDAALRDAVTTRRPAPGVIFHSDPGCQTRLKGSSQQQGNWACACRSGAPGSAGTTRSPSRSSPPSRPSCSTVAPGPPTPCLRRAPAASKIAKLHSSGTFGGRVDLGSVRAHM